MVKYIHNYIIVQMPNVLWVSTGHHKCTTKIHIQHYYIKQDGWPKQTKLMRLYVGQNTKKGRRFMSNYLRTSVVSPYPSQANSFRVVLEHTLTRIKRATMPPYYLLVSPHILVFFEKYCSISVCIPTWVSMRRIWWITL